MAITHVDDIWHFFFKFSWIFKGPYNVSPAKNFVYSLKQFVNIGHERSDWNNSQKVTECHKWLLNGESSLGCHTYCDTRISFILFISENSWHSHLVSLPVSTLYDLGLLRLGLHTVVKLVRCVICIVWYHKRVTWTNAVWNTKFPFLKCIMVRWFR